MVKLTKNEVVLSYQELGAFVRFRRQSLGYRSIDHFAEETGIDRSYILRLETGKQFGTPENFVMVAKGLNVSPGLMMDIFSAGIIFDKSQSLPGLTITLPENFTIQDRQALQEYIEFIMFKKTHISESPPPPWLTASYEGKADQAAQDLKKEAEKKKVDPKNTEEGTDQEETANP